MICLQHPPSSSPFLLWIVNLLERWDHCLSCWLIQPLLASLHSPCMSAPFSCLMPWLKLGGAWPVFLFCVCAVPSTMKSCTMTRVSEIIHIIQWNTTNQRANAPHINWQIYLISNRLLTWENSLVSLAVSHELPCWKWHKGNASKFSEISLH